MHNLGLFVIQKNKKTMIKEKGKEICQRVLDTNHGFLRFVFMVEKVYNKSDRRFANILVLPKAKTQGDLRWKEKNFYRFTAIL